MNEVNDAIKEIQEQKPEDWHMPDETSTKIASEVTDSSLSEIKEKLEKWAKEHGRKGQEDDGGQSESSESELIAEDGSNGEDDETTEVEPA